MTPETPIANRIARSASVGGALLLLAGSLAAPATTAGQAPVDRGLIISAHSDLVALPVTVVDRDGRLVTGLQPPNFAVYENDAAQALAFVTQDDTPVTVGLIIDNSGSMRTKRDDVIAAGLAFAESSNPLDELFTVNFNEHVWPGLPPGVSFAEGFEQLRLALSTVTTRGMTALYDGIATGLEHLDKGTLTRRVLIVVSDGGDNASHQQLKTVVENARRSNAVMYAVGLIDPDDKEGDRDVLKQLAQLTGGAAFFPDKVGQVKEVFQRIAQEIRTSYVLGYVPPDAPRNGEFRRVRVTVTAQGRRGLTARTRSGYFPRL
jgi:Ca-activated chloride channel family protein